MATDGLGQVASPVYSSVCDVDADLYKEYLGVYDRWLDCGYLALREQFGDFRPYLSDVFRRSDLRDRRRLCDGVVGAVGGSGESGTGGVSKEVAADDSGRGVVDCGAVKGACVCESRFASVGSDSGADAVGDVVGSGCDAEVVERACSSKIEDVLVEGGSTLEVVGDDIVSSRGTAGAGYVCMLKPEVKKYVPPAKRGPNGGVSVGRGPNYEKNQSARQRKGKARGFRGVQAVRMPTFDACDQSVRDELQRTRADRLVLENRLRAVKLKQELEVAESRDVQQMIQQQRTQLLRQTELNKVQIEKAHGSLSGEVAGSVPIVPTVVGGTVETVLTGGSISPSSSISEAEIRKLHKDFLDSQARIAKLEKDNYKLRFGVHQEDSEGGPDDGAPWDGGEDSVSQDQFSYRSGYMCTPEQREENKKLALELRGW